MRASRWRHEKGAVMSKGLIAILFDIDGTLITSGGAGTRAWALAFDEVYGTKLDISQLSDLGMTDGEVGSKGLESMLGHKPSNGELEKMLERHLHYLAKTIEESEGYRVLEGAEDLLISLIIKGHMLGLVSGNSEKGAHIKLKRANLNRFFSFGGFGSDSVDRNELTEVAISRAEIAFGGRIVPEQLLCVGDTARDVGAAHAAGIKCVGVASSKFSKQDLKDAGADYVIGSLKEGLPI
ncbi:MAG: HAD family hydrolase [Actinomycetota bacterium]|nr:MAG: HAD family hydrolase [Actinomycetota bacterium]